MAINLDIAKREDITIRRGDTMGLQYRFKSNGNPIDLTGCTIRMHVKNFAVIVLSFSIGNGITVASPISGEIVLSKTKEETAVLKPNKYKYDLEVTYPSGERRTFMYGDFTVNEDQTI